MLERMRGVLERALVIEKMHVALKSLRNAFDVDAVQNAPTLLGITSSRTSSPQHSLHLPLRTLHLPPLLHAFDANLGKKNIHRFHSKLYKGSTYMF